MFSGRRLYMKKQFALLLFISCVAITTFAQSQNQSGTTSPSGTVDCSDPRLPGFSQCVQDDQTLDNSTATPRLGPSVVRPLSVPTQGTSTYTDTAEPTPNPNQRRQALSAPEPITEFQKFVASTTGQVLPIFGESLFRNVPSTFAPLDASPIPADYIVGPGDELRIRVWGQVNFSANLRVDRSGEIYLPKVGDIHVAGLAFSVLEEQLRNSIGRIYRDFNLSVNIGQIRAIQVYVTGEVQHPGVYTISSLSTLVDALFASGGPAVQGSMRHLQLKRDGTLIADFDLYALLKHGDKSKDVKLLPGDIVFIPAVGPQVAVTGSVRAPAIYELRNDETIDDVLTDAGGASSVASESRISIERTQQHRERQAMEFAFDASGLATRLADGDIVHVFSIAASYRETVTLRGNTTNPGRFAWHSGMHLSDLIPDRDSLITRNYWWKRVQLGLAAPEFEPLQKMPNLRQPSTPIDLPRGVTPDLTGDQPLGNQSQTRDQTPGVQDQAGDQIQGAQALAGDQSQGIQEKGSRASSANQQSGNATIAVRQSVQASQSSAASGERTDVRLSAPEINWEFAVIERLDAQNLKTQLLPFDLGKLVLQHDQSQDLELQAGDVVTIFSQADIRVPVGQQTKFVHLEGEVVHAGIYSAWPGETLRHLVERAGGFSPNAYLYGSEFASESTRILQQRRIDEYVRGLEMEIQRNGVALASSPVSAQQDLASGAAAGASERDLVAQLRQIRATGRIVLQFKPNATGLDALPDIVLEDGDSFVVPATPRDVNVIGAVNDQNSFLYKPSGRTSTYLRLAGNPNRNADLKHSFIIRADGSVVGRVSAATLWENRFNQLPINPGDTIVVPEKTFGRSALRGVLDWSQLFSQFALGAAALSVLR